MSNCKFCGAELPATPWNKKFCNEVHRLAYKDKRYTAKTKEVKAARHKCANSKCNSTQARYYRMLRGIVRRKCTLCDKLYCDVCELNGVRVYLNGVDPPKNKETKNGKPNATNRR